MAIKELNHGIKIMKWSGTGKQPAFIFAKGWTLYGHLILRLRGYKPHLTIFGELLKKDIKRITQK
jgi:hypothetical protein